MSVGPVIRLALASRHVKEDAKALMRRARGKIKKIREAGGKRKGQHGTERSLHVAHVDTVHV